MIIENKERVVFNLPASLFKEGIGSHIRSLGVKKIYKRMDPLGGPRVILVLDKQGAMELKAWITVQISTSKQKFFVTDLEEI